MTANGDSFPANPQVQVESQTEIRGTFPATVSLTAQRLRSGQLPDRIWDLLREGGSNYARALAQELGARESAVSYALGSLVDRKLVVVESRHMRRVYYAALDAQVGDDGELKAHDPRPLPDSLTELEVDAVLLRAATPACEIEAIIADNRPVPGL
jgi:hypothetical protein